MTPRLLPLRRRALATLAAASFLVAGPVASVAQADGDDRAVTSAEAVVTVDGARVFDDAFRIVEWEEEVLDAGNYAFAHAKGCEGCQAVALSFQIVIAQEPPEVLKPENVALAVNEKCTSCVAAAGAYQFVVGGKPVRLTDSGRHQLNTIRKSVAALETSGLSGPEMVVKADGLADQVRAVLKAELRPVGDDDDDRGRVEERRVRDKGGDDRSEDRESYEIDG